MSADIVLTLDQGAWHDHSRGQVTFAEYVETVWLPSKHVDTSALAAYRSYLDKHFLPVFGRRPMGKILSTEIQRWVTSVTENGLSPVSVDKTRDGTQISRNTFRTRVWVPAVKASGVDFDVRVHNLRHAHASWLLAGGSDITSFMDRMGHAQITTTQKYLHPMPDADHQTSPHWTASDGLTTEHRRSRPHSRHPFQAHPDARADILPSMNWLPRRAP